MSKMLLERHKKKSLLHLIVTGDEKWIHYDNPKCKKSYVKPDHPAKSTAKTNIHGAKVMLCIWWDQKCVLYYELHLAFSASVLRVGRNDPPYFSPCSNLTNLFSRKILKVVNAYIIETELKSEKWRY